MSRRKRSGPSIVRLSQKDRACLGSIHLRHRDARDLIPGIPKILGRRPPYSTHSPHTFSFFSMPYISNQKNSEGIREAWLTSVPMPLEFTPLNQAPVAQLDRVPGYEPGGRRFESFRARHLELNEDQAVTTTSGSLFSCQIFRMYWTCTDHPDFRETVRLLRQILDQHNEHISGLFLAGR